MKNNLYMKLLYILLLFSSCTGIKLSSHPHIGFDDNGFIRYGNMFYTGDKTNLLLKAHCDTSDYRQKSLGDCTVKLVDKIYLKNEYGRWQDMSKIQ